MWCFKVKFIIRRICFGLDPNKDFGWLARHSFIRRGIVSSQFPNSLLAGKCIRSFNQSPEHLCRDSIALASHSNSYVLTRCRRMQANLHMQDNCPNYCTATKQHCNRLPSSYFRSLTCTCRIKRYRRKDISPEASSRSSSCAWCKLIGLTLPEQSFALVKWIINANLFGRRCFKFLKYSQTIKFYSAGASAIPLHKHP